MHTSRILLSFYAGLLNSPTSVFPLEAFPMFTATGTVVSTTHKLDVAAHIPFMHDAHVLQAYQAGPGYGNYSINLGARPQGTCRAAGSSAGYAALLKNAETSRHHRSHWLRAALYGDCGRRRAPCGLSGRRLTCSRHEGSLQSWPEQIRYPEAWAATMSLPCALCRTIQTRVRILNHCGKFLSVSHCFTSGEVTRKTLQIT